jgi:hypothetical protein
VLARPAPRPKPLAASTSRNGRNEISVIRNNTYGVYPTTYRHPLSPLRPTRKRVTASPFSARRTLASCARPTGSLGNATAANSSTVKWRAGSP